MSTEKVAAKPIRCTLCNGTPKTFTLSEQDTMATRENLIRQVFGFPEGIPIVVTASSEHSEHEDKLTQENPCYVSLMSFEHKGVYEVSLGKEERATVLAQPTFLVLRSKKGPKIEVSVVQTEVDFVSKADAVSGEQLLCHMGVSWGLSNTEGFQKSKSVFYLTSLDARITLISANNMTLLTSDHLPKDEAQTTARTDTRGWNIGAEFGLPLDIMQAGMKLTAGYSSTTSHQSSPTGMFATNHEFWPGNVKGITASVPDCSVTTNNEEATAGKMFKRTDFKHEHRWQVELRHLSDGKLWGYNEDKQMDVGEIPLEAFGNKTKDFYVTYRVKDIDNTKESTAVFVISSIVSGRKTKSLSKVKKFDFRQVVVCHLNLDTNGKMSLKYQVWKSTNPHLRGDLVPEQQDGKELHRQAHYLNQANTATFGTNNNNTTAAANVGTNNNVALVAPPGDPASKEPHQEKRNHKDKKHPH